MYIAVCDDQVDELNQLIDLLQRWAEENKQSLRYRSFRNAAQLLEAMGKERFTLYFLDIIMAGMNGIEVAREIRNADETADIVFLTSSPGFAYESYSVHALDYLLKPISEKHLFPILNRLFAQEQKPQEGLTLKCGSTMIRVPFSQLAFVEVNGKHIQFNLTDGTVRDVFGYLNEYEPILLSRPEFAHIHRSYIVNMLQIREMSASGVYTFSGKRLPVSRLLYPQLQAKYMDLLFSGEK